MACGNASFIRAGQARRLVIELQRTLPTPPQNPSRGDANMKARTNVDVAVVARVVHDAVRSWQGANNQPPSPPWSRAPKWMKDSTMAAVTYRLANPGAPNSAQHELWVNEKQSAGWKRGKIKDGVKKTHPLMIPYDELPMVERRKDALVSGVIDALTLDVD
jgi:hypothetical protein